MIESNTIPYFTSIIVENNTRADLIYLKLLSWIFANLHDSEVFGISDLDSSTAKTK